MDTVGEKALQGKYRDRLLDYLKAFLKVTSRPDEPIAVSVESIADFCDLLRQGCKQDLERLILRAIEDTESPEGKAYLHAFGECIHGGGDIRLWGLPDCKCNRVDCIYCGPRIANRVMSTDFAGRDPVGSVPAE